MAGLLAGCVAALAVPAVVVSADRSSEDRRGGPGAVPAARGEARSATPTVAADARRTAATVSLLSRLTSRLTTGTAARTASLAAPGEEPARRWLRSLHGNVAALGIAGLSLRSAAPDAKGRDVARGAAPAPGTWSATVAVRWRLEGYDTARNEMTVQLVLRESAGRAGFVRVGEGAAPLWLLQRVAVARSPRTLVVSASPVRPRAWSRLSVRAVRDVERVLPAWRGQLVVEVPLGRRQLRRVLGSRPGAHAGVAAVTTTVDRSTRVTAPVHVFVNRGVLRSLGRRGSQVVMSHEATHVATGAALSQAPVWLVEGFADYVALRGVDLPVAVTAGQALARVRADGAPARLPGRVDFAAGQTQVGAAYEGSWLACRLLARQYGERRLVAFYRAADRASSTAAAFRRVLGTDEAAFTGAWRAELRRLAA